MRQSEALAILGSGASVFLTGAPGSGKTYVLNEFIRQARADGASVAVTASTGIAATHINGTTIHSWSGIGLATALTDNLVKTVRTRRKRKLQDAASSAATNVRSAGCRWCCPAIFSSCRRFRYRDATTT